MSKFTYFKVLDQESIIDSLDIKHDTGYISGTYHQKVIVPDQNSYLHTSASEAREKVDEHLSKADASKKIEELQQKTGRGVDND